MSVNREPESVDEPFQRITVAEAKAMVDRREAAIVDVREPNEWVAGHVPEAKHIPLGQVLARAGELPSGRPILFICQMGQRSAVAAEMAAALGRTDLYNVEGGTEAWIKAGYPVKTGQ